MFYINYFVFAIDAMSLITYHLPLFQNPQVRGVGMLVGQPPVPGRPPSSTVLADPAPECMLGLFVALGLSRKPTLRRLY